MEPSASVLLLTLYATVSTFVTVDNLYNCLELLQVEKKIGLIRTFYLFSMILIPSVMLLPNVHYLISDSNL